MEITTELSALVPKEEEATCEGPSRVWTKRIGFCLTTVLAIFALAYCNREWPSQASNLDEAAISGSAFLEKSEVSLPTAQALTEKPQADTRTYQYAKLSNGLSVVNVHDTKAMKTAFAVAVQSGSFNDPKDLPGLAHFCEHMLFLGTKKYPKSGGFSDFMSKNGGSDNAYTADEVTVYFGEVAGSALKEASARYADFFRAPLFDRRFVKKEVHAIDSEHEKNVQNPYWRILQLFSSMADERSPVSRFHTGNFDTLYKIPNETGKSPVDALKVYFKNRYCPSKMHLVTFGSASLADQLRLANKDFGDIEPGSKACQQPVKTFADPVPFPPKSLAKWLVVKGTEPEPSLWLQFPLPDLTKEFQHRPLSYIDHVLGYRGVDSLGRVLEDNLGLATGSGISYDMNSAGTTLYVIITLTILGTKNLETVLDVFFSYLATLRHAGVDKKLYQTLADVDKLNWDWSEPAGPQDTASNLAEQMTRLPPKKLLSGDSLIESPDPKLVSSLIDQLTPDNMNAAYINPNASKTTLFKGQHVETLPYYSLNYTQQDFSKVFPDASERWNKWLTGKVDTSAIQTLLKQRLHDAKIKSISTPFPVVPKPIENVPKQILKDNMKSEPGDVDKDGLVVALFGPLPKRLDATANDKRNTNRNLTIVEPEIWYRSGWVTTSPKVHFGLSLRPLRSSKEPEAPVLDFVRLELYSRLLGQEIAPKMVDLTATGVSYSISVSMDGLSLSFGGFAPVLPQLVHTVLKEFNEFNNNITLTPPSRFARIQQEFLQELNSYTDMPVSYAIGDVGKLLSKGRHSREEVLSVLDTITMESAVKSISELLFSRRLKLTALAMGNLREDEARGFINKISGGIQIPKWSAVKPNDTDANGQVELIKPVLRLSSPVEVRMKNPRDGDDNDVAVVYITTEVKTIESRVIFYLLGKVLGNLAYTELRTNRQLGYVVSAGATQVSNIHAINCVVQGNVLNADDQEAAIESIYTKFMPEKLQNLTDEDFSSYVDSLKQELMQPPITPMEEVMQYYDPVKLGGKCFELHNEIFAYLNSSSVTKQLLIDTWKKHILLDDGMRRKIVVKYFAGKVPPRPTMEAAKKSWLDQGASEGSLPMFTREFKHAKVVDHTDSVLRKQLVDDSGYFPTDIHCHVESDE